MSKIAERKALEVYPMVNPPYSNSDEPKLNVENLYKREGYIKGYDQAMQDFLEKACEYLRNNLGNYFNGKKQFVEQFKNYIENEM